MPWSCFWDGRLYSVVVKAFLSWPVLKYLIVLFILALKTCFFCTVIAMSAVVGDLWILECLGKNLSTCTTFRATLIQNPRYLVEAGFPAEVLVVTRWRRGSRVKAQLVDVSVSILLACSSWSNAISFVCIRSWLLLEPVDRPISVGCSPT